MRARDADLLVWTTTPWTLPSNQFAAVKPDLEYSVVSVRGRAAEADHGLGPGRADRREGRAASIPSWRTLPGQRLIGWRYVPPFDYYYNEP